MCGIAGIIQRNGLPIVSNRLQRMCDSIAHRGPDAEGIELLTRPENSFQVGFGHRRLAILDLSPAGRQPMRRSPGSPTLVFNGEIFNFQSLRQDLQARGYQFSTQTDSEVILALYDAMGDDLLPRLNGMFTLALYDPAQQRVLIARDRFGVKPLYFCQRGDELLFGSEVQAIIAALPAAPDPDPEAISLFLGLGYVPAPWTIYRGIQKLPAGTALVIDTQGIRQFPWYELPSVAPEHHLDATEAKQRLQWLLDDAVRIRLISDRPLGTFLSGGIDSSIISALASRHISKTLETYSVAFHGERMYDESQYARAVASHIGSNHHEIPVTATDMLDAIPQVLDAQHEPFADASAIPTWVLSRETRRNLVVSLSGDGADELFGGYRKYQGEIFQRYYLSVPGALRTHLIEPLVRALPEARDSRWLEGPRRMRRFIDGAAPEAIERQLNWMAIHRTEDVKRIGSAQLEPIPWTTLIRPKLEKMRKLERDPVNLMLRTDVGLCLPDQMLVKVDRMSMQHALEVRTPFLDVRVVELAFQMGGALKLRPGQGKWILLESFRDLLPPLLHKRPKRGFDLPLASWLRKPLQPFVQDLLHSRSSREQPWLDLEGIQQLYAEHLSQRHDHTPRLWSHVCLLWWLQRQEAAQV